MENLISSKKFCDRFTAITITRFKMSIILSISLMFLLKSTTVAATTNNATFSVNDLNFTKLELSKWNEKVEYKSSTKYYARGMAPLYNLTHEILRHFIDIDNPIPEGYIVVSKNVIEPGRKIQNNEWGDLIKHYWAILLVVILTALLVALMPIIGLCFCCCRCAGACGGRSQPFDKKHDTCRRIILGLLLICATTGILFGMVNAFLTNSYMQDGIEEIPTAVRTASDDTGNFLNTTSKQIDHLLVKNYKELSEHLEKLLTDTPLVIIEDLEQKSQAVSLNYLTDFVNSLPYMKSSLERMRVITNELRVNASQLNDGLRGVKRELLVSLTKCSDPVCKEVLTKYEIGKLDANGIDYNQLPDVSGIIDSVDHLINQKIIDDVSTGKNVLKNIRNKINNAIKANTPRVTDAIQKAGQAIKSVSNRISSTFNGISSFVKNNSYKGSQVADEYIKNYGIYRFYAGIAVSSVLLLVFVCLTCALFCGICGKRPDGYGDDCCNKGSGTRFLLLAITVIFLTISILAVIALIHFLIGLVLQRGVCVPLKNPQEDQIFHYVDDFVDVNAFIPKKQSMKNVKLKESEYDYKISEVIVSCKQNMSIYKVLKLYSQLNISEVKNFPSQYQIDDALQLLVSEMHIDSDIVILTESAEIKIKELAQSALKTFDVDKFADNLNDTITKYSLRDIANRLKETAKQINSQDKEMADVRISLKNQALHLETYQDNLVQPMANQSKELANLASQLQKNLTYNGLNFEESITRLLKQIREAQDYINNEGPTYITDIARKLIEHFKYEIETYLNHVIKSVENEVGICQPLANVYDALIVSSCNKIVDPFNGFWVGVGWCILIFLPTLVISTKLSSLYQKSDPYPGPLVESEYMYDAYSERDNIPLANGPKSKKRKIKNRRHRSRDRRGDYFEDSGSSHGGTTGIDTRYSDMAPKHWDGGPPRYTNHPMAPPSSEYERPPPYYYPGAPAEQE